jgi:hypothetical protein
MDAPNPISDTDIQQSLDADQPQGSTPAPTPAPPPAYKTEPPTTPQVVPTGGGPPTITDEQIQQSLDNSPDAGGRPAPTGPTPTGGFPSVPGSEHDWQQKIREYAQAPYGPDKPMPLAAPGGGGLGAAAGRELSQFSPGVQAFVQKAKGVGIPAALDWATKTFMPEGFLRDILHEVFHDWFTVKAFGAAGFGPGHAAVEGAAPAAEGVAGTAAKAATRGPTSRQQLWPEPPPNIPRSQIEALPSQHIAAPPETGRWATPGPVMPRQWSAPTGEEFVTKPPAWSETVGPGKSTAQARGGPIADAAMRRTLQRARARQQPAR